MDVPQSKYCWTKGYPLSNSAIGLILLRTSCIYCCLYNIKLFKKIWRDFEVFQYYIMYVRLYKMIALKTITYIILNILQYN